MKKYFILILFLIFGFFIYQKKNHNNSFVMKNNIPYFYEKNKNFKIRHEEKNKNDDIKIYEIMNDSLYKK